MQLKCKHTKTIHVSRNSKLLYPSFDITIKNCVDLCEYGKSNLCYVKNNPRYMIFNKKKLEKNEKLLNSDNFVRVIKREILLTNTRKFRLFASGDLCSIGHLEKIINLADLLPDIKFWLSTHADYILFEYFKNDVIPPKNLNIILSNKIPNKPAPKFLLDWAHSHKINVSTTTNDKTKSNCHSSVNRESCDLCEKCFEGIDIVYFLHGKYAEKRLKKYESN